MNKLFGQKYMFILNVALEAVLANKVRSFLTALGIIFGVAAVIAMMGIGKATEQEIVKKFQLIGVNNILIQPRYSDEDQSEESNDSKDASNFSPGLNLLDMQAILEVVPTISRVSPEIMMEAFSSYKDQGVQSKLVGVTSAYFDLYNIKISSGVSFSAIQMDKGLPVCIIGSDIRARLFSREDPIGKQIKVGNNWLTIIGVIAERRISESAGNKKLGIRNNNSDVYTPIKTALLRYNNRALVTQSQIRDNDEEMEDNGEQETTSSGRNYHQLDKLVVQVSSTEYLSSASDVITRLLLRRHNDTEDFIVDIPEDMLKQQQKSSELLNQVLFAIAFISLIVGGIGIMNIMLASVMERIKEIGLRMSVGATKQDIVAQFIMESVIISLTGGIAGVILGIVLAFGITYYMQIETFITLFSIILSFGVAAATGLIFGIMPAKKAALQDPIKSLRHE